MSKDRVVVFPASQPALGYVADPIIKSLTRSDTWSYRWKTNPISWSYGCGFEI